MIEEIHSYFKEQELIGENGILNIDFLGEEPTEFSIVQVNSNPIIEQFINGDSIRKLEFQLVSRNTYSAELVNQIANSNFYETLREKIEELNKNKTLPDIDGIMTIECLDSGAIASATPNTCQYSILMQITYYKEA